MAEYVNYLRAVSYTHLDVYKRQALYRTVRDHPRELQERLRYVLNSREDLSLIHI